MAIEKKEGATMTCQECSTKLECHMSNYTGDFQNKLQWQNPDGSAHYKWNGTDDKGNAKFKCMLPETTAPSTNPAPEEQSHNEQHLEQRREEIAKKEAMPSVKLPDDKIAKIIAETELLNAIDKIVMSILKQGEVSPSPQKCGMFTKIIYETYFAPKFEKAISR